MSLNESSPTQTVDDNEQYSLMLDPVVEAFSEDNDIAASEIIGEYADVEERPLTIKAGSIWVSMLNGEQLHMRHLMPVSASTETVSLDRESLDRKPLDAEPSDLSAFNRTSPKRVFMLHGEAECGRIFYHDSGKGLAYHFAQQGYEVFVADLGGRGRSLGCEDEPSSLTVHDIVTDAIPRLLRAATQHCSTAMDESTASAASYTKTAPVAPTVWVAHGFGGVLLSAAWARMSHAERTATQMIFFSSRRQLQAKSRIANVFVNAFCHPLAAKLVNWHGAFPAAQLRLGSANENTNWFSVYTDWISNKSWVDAEDGFDYQAALKANPIPPALHFATTADKLYSGMADVRAFINELGCHDSRMIVTNTIANSKRKYDHLSLLLDPAAVKDIFKDATDWLHEQSIADNINILLTEAVVENPNFDDGVAVSEPTIENDNYDLPFEYSASVDDSSDHNNKHAMTLSLAV